MDVALVIGHHPDAQGATLELEGESVTEWELWAPFARELDKTLPVESTVVKRPSRQPDSELAAAVNHTGADVAIELHFNAAQRSASGCEMLHYPKSTEGRALAKLLQEKTVSALGNRSRGVDARGDLLFLEKTVMPAVICEPFFGSNPGGAFRALTRLPSLLDAYRTAILQYLRE